MPRQTGTPAAMSPEHRAHALVLQEGQRTPLRPPGHGSGEALRERAGFTPDSERVAAFLGPYLYQMADAVRDRSLLLGPLQARRPAHGRPQPQAPPAAP